MKSSDAHFTADDFGRRPITPQHTASVSAPPADDRGRSRPLLVTADPHLREEVLNVARRSGADIDVAPDPITARDRFGSAPLVLVGVDRAESCVRARLPTALV